MSSAPLTSVPPPARSVAPALTAPIHSRKKGRSKQRFAPYLMLAPYFITTTLFFIYPLIYAGVLAFQQTDGPAKHLFVGWSNFRFVLHDADFHRALWNTSVFTLASIGLQLPLSLALAMLLNAQTGRSKGLLRLVIFAPNLVGQVFVGILFSMLFTPRFGLFNKILQALVGWGIERQWLSDPHLVMPAIIIASLWLYVGFNMIYFLAALQNVDQSLVEAALIDGAGPVNMFLQVTVPAIMPVATFVIVTSTIGSFQLFELPFTLLQYYNAGYGADNSGMTIVSYLFRAAFETGDLGVGAAVGWVLTLIILGVALIQIRFASKIGSET